MITAGVDLGSLTAKAVIFQGGAEEKILAYSVIPVGVSPADTARKVIEDALQKIGLKFQDLEYIVATGYGRVVVSFAQRNITEISCHAKGASWLFPEARTILDMGGQDCKAIRCDARGKVTNFLMNDKCAAGAGRSMEVMAKVVREPLESIGKLSLQIMDKPATVSSTCVLFARTEARGLLRKGTHKNDILAGVCDGLVSRVLLLLGRVGVEPALVISGGIAKNVGVVQRVEEKLGVKAKISTEPQIVGALGAALFARDALERAKRTA